MKTERGSLHQTDSEYCCRSTICYHIFLFAFTSYHVISITQSLKSKQNIINCFVNIDNVFECNPPMIIHSHVSLIIGPGRRQDPGGHDLNATVACRSFQSLKVIHCIQSSSQSTDTVNSWQSQTLIMDWVVLKEPFVAFKCCKRDVLWTTDKSLVCFAQNAKNKINLRNKLSCVLGGMVVGFFTMRLNIVSIKWVLVFKDVLNSERQ